MSRGRKATAVNGILPETGAYIAGRSATNAVDVTDETAAYV